MKLFQEPSLPSQKDEGVQLHGAGIVVFVLFTSAILEARAALPVQHSPAEFEVQTIARLGAETKQFRSSRVLSWPDQHIKTSTISADRRDEQYPIQSSTSPSALQSYRSPNGKLFKTRHGQEGYEPCLCRTAA